MAHAQGDRVRLVDRRARRLGGTLAESIDNALPTATAVVIGDSTGNTGGLDLTAANQTVASLAFRSNSATPDTITIGSGKTLTVSGTGSLSIGPSPAADNYTTNVTMSGPGALVVTNTAATVNATNARVGTMK